MISMFSYLCNYSFVVITYLTNAFKCIFVLQIYLVSKLEGLSQKVLIFPSLCKPLLTESLNEIKVMKLNFILSLGKKKNDIKYLKENILSFFFLK